MLCGHHDQSGFGLNTFIMGVSVAVRGAEFWKLGGSHGSLLQ